MSEDDFATPGKRAVAIRGELTRARMAFRMTEKARELGYAEASYGEHTIKRIEDDGLERGPTLMDAHVYAALDPEGRGLLWAGWGLARDPYVRAGGVRMVAERLRLQPPPPRPTFEGTDVKKAAAKRSGRKKGKG